MTPLQRLLGYFARHKQALTAGFLCVLASATFSLMKPLLIGAAAMEGLFLYLQRWILIGASRHIEYEMRNDFYQHLQSLPVRYYQEQRTGDLMSRATNDLASVRMLMGPA